MKNYFKSISTALDVQSRSYEKLKDLEYCAIFLEQGLGKSKIAIDLILYWLKNQILSKVIVFTKKGLIKNWTDEIAKHSHLSYGILSQNIENNSDLFFANVNFLLANFEVINLERPRIEKLALNNEVGIILDESAKIKNPLSKLTQNFLEISNSFKKKCIMTGTPSANRPYDIWSQIKFLDDGRALGYDFESFKKKFDLNNKLQNDQNAQLRFSNNLTLIFEKISHFTVRETKEKSGVKLPKKHFINVQTDWEHNQHLKYLELKEEFRIFIQKSGKKVEEDAEPILKRIIRLIQITSNPFLIDDSYNNKPGKFKSLLKIINKIIANGEKLIIWSAYLKNIYWLFKVLSQYKPLELHGRQTIEQRNSSIEKFKNNDDLKIIIATPQSSKEGLTLTVANHCIFYDRTLSLDDYLQAQDRIHRISQNKDCFIYNLIMKNSIDEWIDSLVNAKYWSAKLLIGDIDEFEFKRKIKYNFSSIIKEILKL